MRDDLSDEAQNILDEVSVLRLELMDKLIDCKKELENSLREGYFMLGKARYIMGVNSVSMLQVPSEDCDMSSVVLAHASEESLLELPSFKNYQFSIIPSPNKNVEEEKVDDEELTGKLRRRGETDSVSNSAAEDVKEINKVKANPINWFCALPPQSLRKAQGHFNQALLKSAECATLQSKLRALSL